MGPSAPSRRGKSGAQRVLLAESHEETRRELGEALKGAGYRPVSAATGNGALRLARRYPLHAAVLDLALGGDGLAILDGLIARQPGLRVIGMGSPLPVALIVASMKRGAADVLAKPLEPAAILDALDRLVPSSDGEAPRRRQPDPTQQMERLGILGRSALMRGVFERVLRIAPHYRTVLVLGESGTGKELIARALHALGPGVDRPFVAVNCATLSEAWLESEIVGREGDSGTAEGAPRVGMMEAADTGTLFLDQVQEMGLACQAKLLRAVERREFRRVGGAHKTKVDVRLIATANVDLEDWVNQKRFRADLYYRLKVLTLVLPPLRERQEAIPILALRFLEDVARASGQSQKRLTPAALAQLLRYDWPGNVRELRHVIEDLSLLGTAEMLDVDDLPENVRRARPTAVVIPLGTPLAEAERRLIVRTLEAQTTVKDAARVLGIGLRTLHTKLRQYGLRGRR